MQTSSFSHVHGSSDASVEPGKSHASTGSEKSSRPNEQRSRANIKAIPAAMRQMGWFVSADLMERWFSNGAWVLPRGWKEGTDIKASQLSLAHLDTRIVSMAWVMGFPRARVAVNELMNKIRSLPTIDQLKRRLRDSGWNGSGVLHLGHTGMSAVQLDDMCQVNFVSFGGPFDTLDDMYGALGKAAMKMAFVGRATVDPSTRRLRFAISDIAFYLRDTYDFNGDQPLGTWSEFGVLNKSEALANILLDGLGFGWHGEPIGRIDNAVFRRYRAQSGWGGDFILYSNVLWKKVDLVIDLS
ncbi:DUF6402 family protein [Luteibacter yeojuensis]|uniref:Uncharacterized protein n=1 Tax=Luteibacter yeojuensis TaxID=345309 RepID=A0A7X5QUJ3_9GAMM|nr:DUF6402 family protein [Luteibacter yeojuensis]NID15670.1 hypothetical protein [Luteibacter yeojuensis]